MDEVTILGYHLSPLLRILVLAQRKRTAALLCAPPPFNVFFLMKAVSVGHIMLACPPATIHNTHLVVKGSTKAKKKETPYMSLLLQMPIAPIFTDAKPPRLCLLK